MPERAVMDWVREWWGVLSFVGVGFASFVAGQERSRWRVHQVGDLVAVLSDRVQHLEKLATDQALMLREIETTLKFIAKE